MNARMFCILMIVAFFTLAGLTLPGHSDPSLLATGWTPIQDDPSQLSTALGFDLQACEQDCRERYGYTDYSQEYHRRYPGGGSQPPGYQQYYRCLQDCQKNFWKDVEKESD